MNCKQCKNEFEPKGRRGRRAGYCSDNCASIALRSMACIRNHKANICLWCYGIMPERGKRGGAHAKYCSDDCRQDSKKEYHALYDSTQEQRNRRIDYAKSKKNA